LRDVSEVSLLFLAKPFIVVLSISAHNRQKTMILLDGKKARLSLCQKLREKIAALSLVPKLAIVQVGDLKESAIYIHQKELFGKEIGVAVSVTRFPSDVGEELIVSEIIRMNADEGVSGIIVQLPLPSHLDKNRIINSISPLKDVDGLTNANLKLLWENKNGGFLPATTKGILSLLEFYGIPVSGKKVVVVGRSSLVGKPTALALLNRDATVTICHSKTARLELLTRQADVLISAVGKPKFLTKDFISAGQVVIDVGISVVGTEKTEKGEKRILSGDVDFENVQKLVSAITPVPGGVGPMTVFSLFENVVTASEKAG
jgi:methylenetetrahydrofolate dehydrogenase (NADP+)/methenyltetrahydrofolate cyclohydrolase